MRKLVLFGAGGFAELAHYYFSRDSDYAVAAFTVDGAHLREPAFAGLPVVPFEEAERVFPPADHDLFVAVGYRRLNRFRAAKAAEAEAKGYRLASFLSSKAVAPGLRLGPNSIVMEQALLHPFVHVGRNTVVWSATRVGFRTRIGDHCWIVSAIFGESVVVGDYAFVGLNATVAPGVRIGESNVVGAGALLTADTKDGQVFRGHASKPSRAPSRRLPHFGQ